jgi:hypothetical protein
MLRCCSRGGRSRHGGTGRKTIAQRVFWWRNGEDATQQCRCCEIEEGRRTMQWCTVRNTGHTSAVLPCPGPGPALALALALALRSLMG